MKKITNYLLVLGIIALGFACDQQENVEPELSIDDKFALFGDEIFDLPSNYSPLKIDTEIIKIGNEIFDSINVYDENNERGRTNNESTYVIEVDGVIFIATVTEDCIYYAHLDCFFTVICSGTGSICD